MSVNSISVLVVSMSSMVSWGVMTIISVVVWPIVVGIWVMSIIMSRVPIIVVSMVSNIVVSIVVLSDVETVVYMSMVESVMIIMMIHWFHLEDQVSS